MNVRLGPLVALSGLGVVAWPALAGTPATQAPAASGYVPCKIEQRVRIEFPVRALHEGVVRGQALVMLEVDYTGKLVDQLAVGYSRPEFAEAALEATKRWRYIPSRVAGEAVGSIITLTVSFEISGVLAYVKPVTISTEPDPAGDDFVYRPVSVANLDRAPVALERAGPVYLREWIEHGKTGTVTVEFFIDEKGSVRFPHVVGQADDMLAVAAIVAVRGWRFTPPMQKGKPVLTKAQQAFHFQPETRPAQSAPATPAGKR